MNNLIHLILYLLDGRAKIPQRVFIPAFRVLRLYVDAYDGTDRQCIEQLGVCAVVHVARALVLAVDQVDDFEIVMKQRFQPVDVTLLLRLHGEAHTLVLRLLQRLLTPRPEQSNDLASRLAARNHQNLVPDERRAVWQIVKANSDVEFVLKFTLRIIQRFAPKRQLVHHTCDVHLQSVEFLLAEGLHLETDHLVTRALCVSRVAQ